MDLEVTGEVFSWRGPAPFHFLALGDDDAAELAEVAAAVTYGWGMVPVRGRLGGTDFTTSLWPKEGTFYVPLKHEVRRAEGVEVGDVVTVHLHVVGL
ncbi:DUF1905 domain-containing protein [Streptomyces sp. NP160]|uniref:DUF1905 domain-containing protein n=1 Tax=Streptomyces sp. NP160 TaxID=2586637 RepID=UPI001119761F|nr:DUF1905 domain-containing protein [Streptomyces sp. NP160]TNM64416.1 DUF1905 domain-containing protein [Streptomyces sp. NP160]